MAGKNTNLLKARRKKNDEFYTLMTDVVNTIKHFKSYFKDKKIYLNADSNNSNFYKYFKKNFEHFKISEMFATVFKDYNILNTNDYQNFIYHVDKNGEHKYPIIDGDFRSPGCIRILNQVDAVITNPPFSIIEEYYKIILQSKKKYILIVPLYFFTKSPFFIELKNHSVTTINERVGEYINEKGDIVRALGYWITNINMDQFKKRWWPTIENSPANYQTYDDYPDVIHVPANKKIPKDYAGKMGVPSSFALIYNPDQFVLLRTFAPMLNGRQLFPRYIIKKRLPAPQ